MKTFEIWKQYKVIFLWIFARQWFYNTNLVAFMILTPVWYLDNACGNFSDFEGAINGTECVEEEVNELIDKPFACPYQTQKKLTVSNISRPLGKTSNTETPKDRNKFYGQKYTHAFNKQFDKLVNTIPQLLNAFITNKL